MESIKPGAPKTATSHILTVAHNIKKNYEQENLLRFN